VTGPAPEPPCTARWAVAVCGRVCDRVGCARRRRQPRGAYTHDKQASLWALGVLLAVYDGAEVVLKPAFGALSDRVGRRPVLLGGLIAFAGSSIAFVLAANPALVGPNRTRRAPGPGAGGVQNGQRPPNRAANR